MKSDIQNSLIEVVVVSSMALFFLGNVTRLKYPSSTSSHDIFEGFSGNLRVSGFLKNKHSTNSAKIFGIFEHLKILRNWSRENKRPQDLEISRPH